MAALVMFAAGRGPSVLQVALGVNSPSIFMMCEFAIASSRGRFEVTINYKAAIHVA